MPLPPKLKEAVEMFQDRFSETARHEIGQGDHEVGAERAMDLVFAEMESAPVVYNLARRIQRREGGDFDDALLIAHWIVKAAERLAPSSGPSTD